MVTGNNVRYLKDFSTDLENSSVKTENQSNNIFWSLDQLSEQSVKGKKYTISHNGAKSKQISKGGSMSQETYSKNEIDLKFENMSNKMDSKFELLSQKIDSGFSNQSLQMNNALLEFKQALKDESEKERKEREQVKKESVRWYVGIVFTIIGTGIAIAGTVAAFLALT